MFPFAEIAYAFRDESAERDQLPQFRQGVDMVESLGDGLTFLPRDHEVVPLMLAERDDAVP